MSTGEIWRNWDIPSLPLALEVRRGQFEKACAKAVREGAIIRNSQGLLLVWKDPVMSEWLRNLSFRGWWCSNECTTAELLFEARRYLLEMGADFAALSSWKPVPECEGFLKVGQSAHAWVYRERFPGRAADPEIEIRAFAEVPDRWLDLIVRHATVTQWHDRHSSDPRLSANRIGAQRGAWILAMVRNQEGFITVRHSAGTLGAYLVVPIDRSRVACGGPAIAGLNGIGGSFHEGRWYYTSVWRASFRHATALECLPVIQYQTENRAVPLLLARTFRSELATRNDVHWWAIK
ncbi:MAG: hypothetical protein PHI34_05450 [Acidobacteriota bacterium]|nr:hypothetical protein [Acidobacteriota bacterium]